MSLLRPITREEFYDAKDKWKLIVDLGCSLLMSWPSTRDDMARLCGLIKSTESGRGGVTSIGCGTGIVEWLMQGHWPPLSIRGVDTMLPSSGLSAEAAWSICYGCALNPHSRNIELASVPQSNALAFFYPIPSSYTKRYIASYRGDCVVVAPSNIQGEIGTELSELLDSMAPEWQRAGSVEWAGKKPTVVTVFQRRHDP